VKETHPPSSKRRAVGLQTVLAGGFAVSVIAAMVMLNRFSAAEARRFDQPRQQQEYATDLATNPVPIETAPAPKRAAKSSMGVNRVTSRRAPESVKSAVTASPARIGDVPENEIATLSASDVTRVANAVDSFSATESEPPPVTITGCLETSTSGDEFRLTDTEGADAPKSRGWRTAFLKKRAVPMTLVGAHDGLALMPNVGKRVAATGLLASRELKVSTLRVVDESCN
jgi:hypothetical protein